MRACIPGRTSRSFRSIRIIGESLTHARTVSLQRRRSVSANACVAVMPRAGTNKTVSILSSPSLPIS